MKIFVKKSQKRCHRNRKAKFRNSRGIYLVEILVAISVGAMLTFALLNTAAISMRHAATTQNEIYADTIIRELMEATRASTYEDLHQSIGEYTLLVNKTNAGEIGPSLRTEPLQLNTVDKIWDVASKNSRFRGDMADGGSVKYKIENGPGPNTLKVTATASWTDSTKSDSSHKRTVSASTIVSKFGANYWNISP